MARLTTVIAGFFLALQIVSVACSASPGTNTNATSNANNVSNTNALANSANDSVEELRSFVQVPFEPEDVDWRLVRPTQGKSRITAVFVLAPDAYKAFASKYNSSGPGADAQVSVEQWFPAELKAMSEISGEMTIGGKAYAATDFFQDPYTSGNIILIPETNYAVLEVQSK